MKKLLMLGILTAAIGAPVMPAVAEEVAPEDAAGHFVKGLQHAEEGDIDSAVREIRRAWSLDPEAVEIPLELARLLLEGRRLPEAEEAASAVIQLDAGNAEAYWILGQTRMLQSRDAEALASLQRAHELEPKQRSYRMSYLLALESAGRHGEALNLLLPDQGGVEPDTPFLYLRRGILRTRVGMLEEALEDILECMELAPGFPGAADHLLSVCWRLGPSPLTASACQRAIALDPARSDLRRELARVLILLNRTEEAVPDLERLLDEDPSDATIPMQLGVIRFGEERLSEAISLFRRAHAIDPKVPDVGDWLWRALSRADSAGAALAVAETMAKEQPGNATARWYCANSLARLGKIPEALDHLEAAIELDPDQRESRLLAAVLLEEEGRRDEARTHLMKILDRRPEDRETLFRLGVLEERADRIPEALAWFRQLLKVHPDDAMALNYAGYMCADRRIELEQALEWTRRAVALESENAAYLDSYGWALYQLGRNEEAVTQLERAHGLDAGEVEIALHLAKAYRAAGKNDEARRVLRRILDEHPEERQARELLQLWERGEPGSGNPR